MPEGFPGDDASGDLIAAGGNGLLLVNLDDRFPIAGPLQGAIFFDISNVWADWRDIESSDLRAGVGLRYLSPIGPLRIEVGWPFDKLPGRQRRGGGIRSRDVFLRRDPLRECMLR
ncbi:MAG: BamA/TamA family outer membrane protein [Acidobacteriota bacterium]